MPNGVNGAGPALLDQYLTVTSNELNIAWDKNEDKFKEELSLDERFIADESNIEILSTEKMPKNSMRENIHGCLRGVSADTAENVNEVKSIIVRVHVILRANGSFSFPLLLLFVYCSIFTQTLTHLTQLNVENGD